MIKNRHYIECSEHKNPPLYPETAQVDVSDNYGGVQVTGPYRWLENLDSQVVREWVEAQNRLSQSRLEEIPARAWVKHRLAELLNYERVDVPVKIGGRYFFLRNDGKQNHSVLFVSESLDSSGRVLFDPNAVREDATTALSDFMPSPKGDLVAYALSDGGTDWQIWHFRRVRDGKDLADSLRFIKFWGVSWARDGSGVYYTRYPALANGKSDDAGRPAVYFHKLSEPQENDALVYAVTDHPTRVPIGKVTEDGHYLVVTLFDGHSLNGVDLLDLRRLGSTAVPLFSTWDALYTFVGASGDHLYFKTTKNAPLGRVITVDVRDLSAEWATVVPEDTIALEAASYVGGRIVAKDLRDAHSVARLYERGGQPVGEIPLPGVERVDGFSGEGKETETFFSFMDYLTPAQVYRFDVASNQSTLWYKPSIAASIDAYVTEQVFYPSKDGTRVPMHITRRRDMPRDGNQPLLLYGYGGVSGGVDPRDFGGATRCFWQGRWFRRRPVVVRTADGRDRYRDCPQSGPAVDAFSTCIRRCSDAPALRSGRIGTGGAWRHRHRRVRGADRPTASRSVSWTLPRSFLFASGA